MSFPINPTNGQQTTVNGVLYQYSVSDQSWTRVTLSFTPSDPFARNQANLAFDQANLALSTAVTGIEDLGIDLQNIQTSQNNKIQVVFDQANSANILAQSSFNQANSANSLAQSAFNKANSANVLAQAAFDKTNTTTTFAQAAFNTANTAAAVNTTQNTNITIIQGVNTWQNTRITAIDAFAQAAYNQANTGGGGGGGGAGVDQYARDTANAAFTAANNASGGGIGGPSFSTITVSGQSQVIAEQANDVLTLVAGSGITITTNNITDTVTITNTLGDQVGVAVTNALANNISYINGVNAAQNTSLSLIANTANAALTASLGQNSMLNSVTNNFTGDGNRTAFGLSRAPVNVDYTFVAVGGVLQPKNSYSLNGLNLIFSQAPPFGAFIEVTILSTSPANLYSQENIISPFLLMGA